MTTMLAETISAKVLNNCHLKSFFKHCKNLKTIHHYCDYSALSPLTLYHEAETMGIQSAIINGQTLGCDRFLSKGYNFLGKARHKYQFRILKYR